MKKSFSDILSSLESAKDDKLREKLPSWAAAFTLQDTKGGYCVQDFPKLSLEQCSSELTALYKAGLAEALMEGRKGTLCDLCCGLGADSWAFSKVCSRVDAFEADSSLAPRRQHIFPLSELTMYLSSTPSRGPEWLSAATI